MVSSQSHFNGTWYEVESRFSYIKIYQTSEGQFLEYYTKSSRLISTKEIINPYMGDSYTITRNANKKYEDRYNYLKLIDDNHILYSDT